MISGINEILSENAALTTLLGENKIYPVIVSESVNAPFLAVSLLRVEPTDTKGEDSGQDYPVININVHAENYDDLEEISESVREALDNITATTEAGYVFTRIWYVNEFDRPDLYGIGVNGLQGRQLYTRSIQFRATVKR